MTDKIEIENHEKPVVFEAWQHDSEVKNGWAPTDSCGTDRLPLYYSGLDHDGFKDDEMTKVRVSITPADQPTEVEIVRAELLRRKKTNSELSNRAELSEWSHGSQAEVIDILDWLDAKFGTGEVLA